MKQNTAHAIADDGVRRVQTPELHGTQEIILMQREREKERERGKEGEKKEQIVYAQFVCLTTQCRHSDAY